MNPLAEKPQEQTMKYLFSFADMKMCSALRRDLKAAGVACEIHVAHEFPQGDQGPEIWVHNTDFKKAQSILRGFQLER